MKVLARRPHHGTYCAVETARLRYSKSGDRILPASESIARNSDSLSTGDQLFAAKLLCWFHAVPDNAEWTWSILDSVFVWRPTDFCYFSPFKFRNAFDPETKVPRAVHLISISPISLNIRGSHCGNPVWVVTLVTQSVIAASPQWPEVSRYPWKNVPLPPLWPSSGRKESFKQTRGSRNRWGWWWRWNLDQVDSCQQRLLIHVVWVSAWRFSVSGQRCSLLRQELCTWSFPDTKRILEFAPIQKRHAWFSDSRCWIIINSPVISEIGIQNRTLTSISNNISELNSPSAPLLCIIIEHHPNRLEVQ